MRKAIAATLLAGVATLMWFTRGSADATAGPAASTPIGDGPSDAMDARTSSAPAIADRSSEPANLLAASTQSDPKRLRFEAARGLTALINDWDDHAFEALRTDGPASVESWKEELAFYREALGSCQAPTLIHEAEERSRYLATCERGSLELAPMVDVDGRLLKTRWGARDIEPSPEVREAAEGALALRMSWDDTLAEGGLAPSLDREALRQKLAQDLEQWGPCALGEVDLGNRSGAIFNLDCQGGERSMKVHLAPDRRILRLRFFPRRQRQ